MSNLPVSIISPVRNCRSEMPAHAAHLRELSRIAGEIIIVDSDSADGTLDYLRENLGVPGAVFLNHPPGLYPSWNHGIAHVRQPFLTVATVGDNLPPESLAKLYHDLEESSCDVVISAPVLLNPDGSRSKSKWPIHQLIENGGLSAPQQISQAAWLALGLGFFPKSLLASSSGNLYRRRAFKGNLFPTDCGHRGDVIWAITSARKLRWMVDPTVESSFKFNGPSPHKEPPNQQMIDTWAGVAMRALEEESDFMRESGVPPWFLDELHGMLENTRVSQLVETEYRSVRRGVLPWFFNPRAVRLRKQRKILKTQSAAGQEILTRCLTQGFWRA